MSGTPAYERDPYLCELPVTVLEVGETGGRPFAVLDDTVLYPEGGGQPGDRGTLSGVAVLDTRREGGQVRHLLAAPVDPGPALLRLDWARRFDHMQQHSAQHLLTATALTRFGWRTTAFHLSEAVSDVELDVPRLAQEQLGSLEDAVAGEVRAARAITCRRVNQEEAGRLPVRSRGVPEGLEGDLRLVEIAGVDLNTCGGTHVRSTAELEAVKLLSTEPMRGGTRVFFVAGGRARRRLAAAEARLAELRRALDTGDEELVAIARLKLEQLAGVRAALRRTEEELAEATAQALATRSGALVDAHFETRDAAFIQVLGRRLVELAPGKAALLTAGAPPAGCFVVVAGEQVSLDVPAVGREVAELLQGRGGGSRRSFQGKAAGFVERARAVARLRAAVGGGGAA